MQGLDEAGLQAYSGHLQKEFLRPDVSSGKRPQEDVGAGSDEDMDDGETEDPGPAPEDAARRCAHRRKSMQACPGSILNQELLMVIEEPVRMGKLASSGGCTMHRIMGKLSCTVTRRLFSVLV